MGRARWCCEGNAKRTGSLAAFSGAGMPSRRITIRRIKELLRLRYECGLSLERVARAQNLSKGVVAKYVKRAAAAGIVWDEMRELDETEFAARLQRSAPLRVSSFAAPDFAWIHQELKKKSVTLQLLWEEYRSQCAGRPYGYTSFCIHYRRWALQLKRSMRQVHRAGEKLFVDYAGQTMPVLNAITGEIRQAQVFVAALGASSYTFACATWTQRTVDWIGAHVDTLGFIGGCPECVVSDNPRALIADPDRYEPEVGRAYAEFATHYSIAILPARPRKPRDKAAVESAVGVVSRWILARLRHRQFFSLAELNAAIASLLTELNGRPSRNCLAVAARHSRRWIVRRCVRCRQRLSSWRSGRWRGCRLTTTSTSSAITTASRINWCARRSTCASARGWSSASITASGWRATPAARPLGTRPRPSTCPPLTAPVASGVPGGCCTGAPRAAAPRWRWCAICWNPNHIPNKATALVGG